MNKDYTIYTEGLLWKIKWQGGGEMSPKLKGHYTSQTEAIKAIKEYEKQKPATRKANRSVNNGKSEDTA